MSVPTAVLKVALALGPNDEPVPGDWTDLSTRIRSVKLKRGRDNPLDEFGAGRLTVELDNSDRALDPSNPDGLVYAADGLGLPLCPVTLDLKWNGTSYRRFTGYLGPDCWSGGYNPSGTAQVVTLEATDALGFSPSLPGSLWAMMVSQLGHVDMDKTFWYLPMDHGFPVLVDGSPIKNRSGFGGTATFYSPAPGDLLGRPVNNGSGERRPVLQMPEESFVVSEAADIMPDGDEVGVTVVLFWRSAAEIDTGDTAYVATWEYPGGGGNIRWAVRILGDGAAHCYTYDAAGVGIDTEIIYAPAGRWDEGDEHLVIVRQDGDVLDVWFAGEQATLDATADVYESDLTIGPSPAVSTFIDEVAVIRRALSDDEIAGVNLMAGTNAVWFGFSHADVMGAFFEAAGKRIGFDEVNEWHVPVSDPDYGFIGLNTTLGYPKTLAEAAALVAGPFGARWVTKDGNLRVRTIDALTPGGDYDAHYVTTAATFTDEDATLGAGEYRHAGLTIIGPQLDRVVNIVEATFRHLEDPYGPNDYTEMVVKPDHPASIARYGKRSSQSITVEFYGWERAATVADTMLERYAEPSVEIQSLNLDATGDAALTLWLCQTCELELSVDVVYSPVGQDPVTIADLNIQGEDLELTPTTFRATLNVSKS